MRMGGFGQKFMRFGQAVLVQFNAVLFFIGLFWWFLLAVVHARLLAVEDSPYLKLVTLVLLPAILFLLIGLFLGIIIGEESVKTREQTHLQAKQHANYGATMHDWPKAVEHV